MTDQTSLMKYQPLDHWDNRIRVINLLPKDESPFSRDEIRCTLDHVSLVAPPPYVALSYCWGDPKVTDEIFVNGQSFQATRNLHAALRELRTRGYRTLWIDAICINQNDVNERNSQLLRMGAIYRRAKHTVAWLGDEHSDSSKAISLIDTLVSDSSDQNQNTSRMKSQKITYGIDQEKLANVDPSTWKAFSQFLGREYWRRIWITQELALSQDVIILCGSHKTTWSKLDIVLKAVSKSQGNTQSGLLETKQSPEFYHLQNLQHFHADAKSDKPVHFLTALSRTQDSLATEVRDKVFAILGLTYNGSAFVAVPNYRQNIQELCLEITMSALSQSGSLDTFALFGNSGDVGDWPSWIPNWLSLPRTLDRRCKYLMGDLDLINWPRSYGMGLSQPRSSKKPLITRIAWNASASYASDFILQRSTLRVRGHLLDHSFVALSSTLCGSNDSALMEGHQTIASPHKDLPHHLPEGWFKKLQEKASDSKDPDVAVLEDLYEILLSTCNPHLPGHDIHISTYIYAFSDPLPAAFSVMTLNKDAAREKYPDVVSWFENNELFTIRGKTMREMMDATKGFSTYGDEDRGYEGLAILESILKFNMRLSVTQAGYLAWTDEKARAGDRVALLLGCSVPVILRPRAEGGWQLVGDAIIPGLMNGEGLENIDVDELEYISLH